MPMSISVAGVVADRIPEVRQVSGVGPEQVSNRRIERLLRSYFFDVPSTAAAVRRHYDLAYWFDSMALSYYVEETLASKRFRYIGLNSENNPIVVIDWLWGQFSNVPGGLETLLEAYIVFIRRTSALVKAQLSVPEEVDFEPEFEFVNVGGPPPMDFMKELLQLRSVDFPEVVVNVVLYPMDPSTAVGEMISGFIRGCNITIPKCAFKMVSTVSDLVESVNAPEGLIPDDVLFRDAPTADEKKAIVGHRTDMFLTPPMEDPIDAPLPTDVMVKNTFIDVGIDDVSNEGCGRRRSNSFGGTANAFDSISMQDRVLPAVATGEGSASAGSDCSTADTPTCEQIAVAETATADNHHAQARASPASGLPPCVDDLLSPLLRDLSLQELPQQLECNAAILREAATYLATLAEHARATNNTQVWHELVRAHQVQYQQPDETDVPGVFQKSFQFGTCHSLATNAAAAAAAAASAAADDASSVKAAKGPSGAQRRKQKKAAAKRYAADVPEEL